MGGSSPLRPQPIYSARPNEFTTCVRPIISLLSTIPRSRDGQRTMPAGFMPVRRDATITSARRARAGHHSLVVRIFWLCKKGSTFSCSCHNSSVAAALPRAIQVARVIPWCHGAPRRSRGHYLCVRGSGPSVCALQPGVAPARVAARHMAARHVAARLAAARLAACSTGGSRGA